MDTDSARAGQQTTRPHPRARVKCCTGGFTINLLQRRYNGDLVYRYVGFSRELGDAVDRAREFVRTYGYGYVAT